MCPALCNTMDYIVHEIPQPRILEWVTFPFSRGSSQPRNRTQVSGIAADSLSAEPQSESEVAQLCPALCDPMDCSLPGFSIHGIFQARILEWVTISFSRGPSRPRDPTRVSHIGGRRYNLWATREARVSSIPFLKLSFTVGSHCILYAESLLPTVELTFPVPLTLGPSSGRKVLHLPCCYTHI